MSNEREAPPAPEVRLKQLSERCAQLERLLEYGLELTTDPLYSSKTYVLTKWHAAVKIALPVKKKLTPEQKLHLTQRCERVGINAFIAEGHIMVASTVDGPALERLSIELYENPLPYPTTGEQR